MINENLGERKLGDLIELKSLGERMQYDYTTEQLRDETLKTKDGESMSEACKRFSDCLQTIITKTNSKK